jgi:hypothetical protein
MLAKSSPIPSSAHKNKYVRINGVRGVPVDDGSW